MVKKFVAMALLVSGAAADFPGCTSVSAEKRQQVETAQNAMQNPLGYQRIQRRNNAEAMTAGLH